MTSMKVESQPEARVVDDMLSRLSVEEKIGQLFMVATVADPDFINATSFGIGPVTYQRVSKEYIDKLIETYHIGGIIFQRLSTPGSLVSAIDHYQTVNKRYNKVPLLIGQDLEWGLSMRMVDVIRFPHNMTLGALQDNKLIYAMGREIGRQCEIVGVHINFSPVVDINTNPSNPIIGDRSFGENKKVVAQKAIAMMKGLQDVGIIACAKHFPGHGDTSQDSHLVLPVVEHSRDRLHSIELYPFRQLIKHGIQAIMTAHLDVPALAPQRSASSLSRVIVTNLLHDELKFNGLTITDGLDMKGVLQNKVAGSVELQALYAGNDILLCSKHIPEAMARIKRAIDEGELSIGELDNHVRRILQAKLHAMDDFKVKPHGFSSDSLLSKLNTKEASALKKSLYYKALTLVKNDNALLPLKRGASVACVQLSSNQEQRFFKKLASYFCTSCYQLSENANTQELNELIKKIDAHVPVVISFMGLNRYRDKDYGVSPTMRNLVEMLCRQNKNIILTCFGIPYACKGFETVSSILMAYEDDMDAQDGAADVIAGVHKPTGMLPVTVSSELKVGLGL